MRSPFCEKSAMVHLLYNRWIQYNSQGQDTSFKNPVFHNSERPFLCQYNIVSPFSNLLHQPVRKEGLGKAIKFLEPNTKAC